METPPERMRVLRFGPFEANFATGELRKHGIRLKLQDQPFQVLKMLLARPGELVTREEIRQRLWPSGTFVDFDNGLNAAVNRLREALGDSAEHPKFIETLPRRGYRFIGALDGMDPGRVPAVPSVSPFSGVEETAERARPWWSGKTALAACGVALAVLLALGTWFSVFGVRGQVIDSVAVLPFASNNLDPDMEYLCDGLTESLINNLSQLPNLRVMARSTAFRYKGKEVDPQKVGQDLHVRAVLSGRILRRGDTLIVQAELMDLAKSSQLWGGQYKRKDADAFALQEDLSKEISEELRLRLTPEEKQRLTKRYTENAQAYHLYLKGRFFWNKWTDDGVRKGMSYFQEAIKADPNYALAYAGLAESYVSLGDLGIGVLPPREANAAAESAALKAIALDDTGAEGHTALAMARFRCDGDLTSVEKEFKRAIELSPGNAAAHHWYSHYLLAMGRTQEALAEGERAYDLSPIDPEMGVHLQWLHYNLHDYDQVVVQGRKTLELDPSFAETHWFIGLADEQERMYEQAASELQTAVDLSGRRISTLSSLGHFLAVSGDRRAALKILAELNALSKQRYVPSYEKALIYVGLGENSQALTELGEAYKEDSYWMFNLKYEPRIDPLRPDPRYAELLRRINLPQ